MDDEDKQYEDVAEDEEEELDAHGFHAEGEDEEGPRNTPAPEDESVEEERF